MFTRKYFISVEKSHGDGTGSYTFNYATIRHKSLLPNPELVFEDAKKHYEEDMRDIPGDKIRVISFNRI